MKKVTRTIESAYRGGYVRVSYIRVSDDICIGYDETGLHLEWKGSRFALNRGLPEYQKKLKTLMEPTGKAGMFTSQDYFANPMVEEEIEDLPILFLIGQCVNIEAFVMEAGKEDLQQAYRQWEKPQLINWERATKVATQLKQALREKDAYTNQAYSAWFELA